MSKKILILGANGFIGSWLSERILADSMHTITAIDLAQDRLYNCIGNPRFSFKQGDVMQDLTWIEEQVAAADIVLPLAAIANPALYVSDPLRVFALDFEANLYVVKLCAHYKKHVIFPSTSEIYGMSQDAAFDEDTTNIVLGPINKQRWIYSCAKQMLDRVIYAYGTSQGLGYTLFRPFNWIGPRLDSLSYGKPGSTARSLTQFIDNILFTGKIKLVDGGAQRRCFTYIGDGIDALFRIIENVDGAAFQQIFNIGNPNEDYSMAQMVDILLDEMKAYPQFCSKAEAVEIITVDGGAHYGAGYQDVTRRVPKIEKAQRLLGWTPQVDLRHAIRHTLEYLAPRLEGQIPAA